MEVLIVEDEDAIAEPLAEALRREGFTVSRVATATGFESWWRAVGGSIG